MINEQIRDKEIRVIGENGEQLGIMSARDAMKLAKEAGANIRIKKNVVIDLELIDKYLENNCEGEEGEN